MTEHEWLTGSDQDAMLAFLLKSGTACERKLRLLVVGCARLRWDCMRKTGLRDAVEAAERSADGVPYDAELAAYHSALLRLVLTYRTVRKFLPEHAAFTAALASTYPPRWLKNLRGMSAWGTMKAAMGDRIPALLRCVFGNPFRPTPIAPSCLTADVVALARDMYDHRSFDRTPELAAALRAGGCDDGVVLDHLAAPSEHVRGCWAVDLVLGRS